jgi:NAD(P)-dependent dehydrogenase (short-subunit alcohol dehydrogenase family)
VVRVTSRLLDLGGKAALVTDLSSPASDYMTGQTLFVDGGRTAT